MDFGRGLSGNLQPRPGAGWLPEFAADRIEYPLHQHVILHNTYYTHGALNIQLNQLLGAHRIIHLKRMSVLLLCNTSIQVAQQRSCQLADLMPGQPCDSTTVVCLQDRWRGLTS